jgi:hypothetical protein
VAGDQRAKTLGELIDQRERGRFVGRVRELSLLEACLGNQPPASVVLVHGPAGIGKSSLLRELARRARVAAWDVFFVEGRELPPEPDALEAALAGARASPRPLVLIDTYERMTGLDGRLRRDLLPALPGDAVVVIAGRGVPDPAWLDGGWQEVVREIHLTRLERAEALGLLTAHGVDQDRADTIAAWAEGSPLALALAAETATQSGDWNPVEGSEHPEVLRSLMRRIVDGELEGERLSALAVASIARVTTPELLAAVLPESDTAAAYDRLRELSFTEPLGDGLALHELVRRTLQADFHQRDPERERELRRRIADHLYAQAQRQGPLVAIELAHLIENPTIRWGFGWEGSIDHRIDVVRPGDAERAAAELAARGFAAWWESSKLFFEGAPERVAVARDKNDRVTGYAIAMSPATAPPFARSDPLLGPWLAHAEAMSHLGDSVLWRDSIDFTRDPRGRVQAMLGVAGVLRSGAANPRFAYMPINPAMPAALQFAHEMAAEHLPELDLVLPGARIECHRIDYGHGGLTAAERAVVYRELGLPDPRSPAQEAGAELETVRAALRNFRIPAELARSPLAHGQSVDERAESVRAILRDAAERAFGDTENENLLKRVLVRGYLEAGGSHEQVADELHLSRAAYFRRLRTSTERLAEYLASGPAGR